ncbi:MULTISPECIES: MATE family efflux transporter [Kitasatospora]|uniref:Putative MatE family transporter n=1 Tax=Kitasatospora setae (strain ATCC 33774 / DSM 43861 / JCM 3304 / KCC A-0304 / NBRC 14216 / KM-6054) TaxID=452652 RepID=E4NJ81_KITSK|nr:MULTISPECIES: MATE family efflux transporter [Kitasatospora]BAJ33029.1 putative MatE family transporter [Kitasatospora setae KM-6054]
MTGETTSAVGSREPALAPLDVSAGRFALSILLGLLAGLVLQTWTVAFLGRLGPEALYVRSVYTPVGYLVLAVTEGLVVAAQVSAGIAGRTGRGRYALGSVPTFFAVGAGLLALQAVVVLVAAGPFLTALGVAPEARRSVLVFVVAVAAASVLGLIPYLGTGVLRGLGHTGPAAWLGVLFTALSIAGTTVLHAVTGLGVLAVPFGGLPATAIVGAAVVIVLKRKGVARPVLAGNRDAVRELLGFAAPVAGTFLLLSTVTFGYLRVLRAAGTAEVAGFALGQMAVGLLMVIAMAVGSGAAIAVTLRPGDSRRGINYAGLITTLRLSIPPYLLLGTAAFLCRETIARALTTDQAAASVAAEYFAWVGPTLVLFGGTLALLGYLEQIGRAGAAFLLNVVYFAAMLGATFLIPGPVDAGDLSKLMAVGNVLGFIGLWFSARFLVLRS